MLPVGMINIPNPRLSPFSKPWRSRWGFGEVCTKGAPMATKTEVLESLRSGRGCLGRTALDEPVFILRAQDILAPRVVVRWAHLRRLSCNSEGREVKNNRHSSPGLRDFEKDRHIRVAELDDVEESLLLPGVADRSAVVDPVVRYRSRSDAGACRNQRCENG